MAENNLPQAVTELLKPINTDTPTGEDISKSEDPVANAAYSDLEMEITKHGNINYQKTAQMASDILLTRSKHLRVAAWLCLSWFRNDGAEGLKNGLLLILQLLKSFNEKLFPENLAHRSKAIQFISMDKRFHTLDKTELGDPAILNEINETLNDIIAECKSQFEETPPNLSQLSEIIKSRLGSADEQPALMEESETVAEESESAGPEAPVKEKAGEVPEKIQEAKKETPDGEDVKEDAPEIIDIADEVSDLLEDISADNPTGDDIENTEDQDAQVVYMQLESEMAKYSGNKYPECLKWAQEILQARSKHLRVAVWLFITWYKTDKLDGFRNGLQLLVELLKKYGNELHPLDVKQKSKIIQTINADTRIKIFSKVKVDQNNADLILELGSLFNALKEQADIILKETLPKLNVIQDIIEDKVVDAKDILDKDKKEAQQAEKVQEANQQQVGQSPATKAVTTQPVSTAPASATGLEITNDKSAKVVIKKALQFFFQEGTGDTAKKKIAENPTVYALSRSLRWSKLNQPAEKDKVTQVEGPNKVKQEFIQKLYANKDWDKLIPDLETNFITNDAFTFWLDAQHYVVQALELKGGNLNEVATEIKIQLARFVTKLPGIINLIFKDTVTPFASKETVEWIQDDVMSSFGSVKSKEKILPPILGEDYAPINKEYEEVCGELPEKFAENARAMQQAIDGETRKKGRFLRLLNLANYCYLAKKYILAQPLFDQLMEQIKNYHISEWETALCVSVWQSAYINNEKLLSYEKDEQRKAAIITKQKELFDKIVKYDAVLALNLEEYKHNEGE